jgi:hypothetical protein
MPTKVFSRAEGPTVDGVGKSRNVFGSVRCGLSPRRCRVTNFQCTIIKEVFPLGRKVGEFNLSNTSAAVITLSECPLKAIGELEVAK